MSRTVRRRLSIMYTVVLFCAPAPHASAQSAAVAALDVINRAPVAITDLRLASRAMGSWSNNLLSAQVEPGQQRRVVPERQEGCIYSVRIIYKDNRYERFAVIDLCRNTEYVFAAKSTQPVANQGAYAAPPSSEVTIVNKSARTISFIRMSPVNERMWGPDRLGNDRTLASGKSLNIPLEKDKGCLYRLRAFYDDNLSEIVPSANLCDEHTLTLRRSSVVSGDDVPANMRLSTTGALFVSNQSGQQIDWIHVFPRGEGNRGPDRLGNKTVLPPGRQMRIDVSDQNLCFVTVLAIYQDRREEPSQALDLCAVQEPTVVMRGPAGGGSPSRP